MKQDVAPILTCENENLQVGVGAVGCRSEPLDSVERRSVHPSAPIPLPQSRHDSAGALVLQRQLWRVAAVAVVAGAGLVLASSAPV